MLEKPSLASEIAKDINNSDSSTARIVVNVLGMNRVNARLGPKVLYVLQKRRRVEITKEILDNVAKELTFIKRIISNNET